MSRYETNKQTNNLYHLVSHTLEISVLPWDGSDSFTVSCAQGEKKKSCCRATMAPEAISNTSLSKSRTNTKICSVVSPYLGSLLCCELELQPDLKARNKCWERGTIQRLTFHGSWDAVRKYLWGCFLHRGTQIKHQASARYLSTALKATPWMIMVQDNQWNLDCLFQVPF